MLLLCALKQGHTTALKLLLENGGKGREPGHEQRLHLSTPVYIASRHGHVVPDGNDMGNAGTTAACAGNTATCAGHTGDAAPDAMSVVLAYDHAHPERMRTHFGDITFVRPTKAEAKEAVAEARARERENKKAQKKAAQKEEKKAAQKKAKKKEKKEKKKAGAR